MSARQDAVRFQVFLTATSTWPDRSDLAAAVALAVAPLDDEAQPSRRHERAVRARSRGLGFQLRSMTADDASEVVGSALAHYRELAFANGERYYQTRYDKTLAALRRTGTADIGQGWYPDPYEDSPAGTLRYWDGAAWTDHSCSPSDTS